MFLPNASALDEKKTDEDKKKKAFKDIEKWSLELMPEAIRDDAVISSQEIVCRDPECSPIDTVVLIVFQSGMDGSIGIPSIASEVTKEELRNHFPTVEVLEKWYQGEVAEWPPIEEELPRLRFDVSTRVLCRIGPDVETDWTPGTITQLWYSEKGWPHGSYAPYKVKLDDGRQIFAPGDIDQVVRRLETEEKG